MIAGVAMAIMLATVLFLYFFVIRDTNSEAETVGATTLVPSGKIDTSFKTDIFEDSRIKNFKQYGPATVQVNERGRKADPFLAF